MLDLYWLYVVYLVYSEERPIHLVGNGQPIIYS